MSRILTSAIIAIAIICFPSLLREALAVTSPATERPLILEPNQGEARVWRPFASLPAATQKLSSFIIKIDKQNGGSQSFWFMSEIMPVGAAISYHRHLHEDEVLYIGSGVAHAHVGAVEGDAHAGALIFIPRNTWVSVRNVGKTPLTLIAAFNAPGFDRFVRCESVPLGENPLPITVQEDRRCQELGDVRYR